MANSADPDQKLQEFAPQSVLKVKKIFLIAFYPFREGSFQKGLGVQGNKYIIIYHTCTYYVYIVHETNCCIYWDTDVFRRSLIRSYVTYVRQPLYGRMYVP